MSVPRRADYSMLTLHPSTGRSTWRAVTDVTRDTGRGDGRREIYTLNILTVSTGIDLPRAAQAIRISRRRHRLDRPKLFTTETVCASPT